LFLPHLSNSPQGSLPRGCEAQLPANVKKPASAAHTERAHPKSTVMWFLRHGETDWNLQRRIQGWKGTHLNALGRRQARLAAARLERIHFDAIYSSDILRCRQTAQAVLKGRQGLRLQTLIEARERCFGAWEGQRIEDIFAGVGRASGRRPRDPFMSSRPPQGETMAVFMTRMRLMLRRLEQEQAGRSVLVVTHGGPVRLACCVAAGVPWRQYYLFGRPGNTSLSCIMSQGGVRWVQCYNDMAHLEVEA
jgi:probable phosphoglycerate mutase